jgi:hypothetical protein
MIILIIQTSISHAPLRSKNYEITSIKSYHDFGNLNVTNENKLKNLMAMEKKTLD